MSLVQRTKFLVTEVREHVSHDVHTIEDFAMRHFGHTPVPANVKIEVVETGHVETEPAPQGNPNQPEVGPANATQPAAPAAPAEADGQAAQPAA